MLQPISVNTPIYFKKDSKQNVAAPSKTKDDNPISRRGEAMKLMTATFLGGLALAGKLLVELLDLGDFFAEIFADKAEKATNKTGKPFNKQEILQETKKEVKNRKILNSIGAFAALTATFFCGFALLYTIFHAPKIAYTSKVNSFKKSKEMDVYVKSNEAEKELYTQLDEKAKNTDSEDKAQLKEQYLKLKNAKNQVPDFVNLKLK